MEENLTTFPNSTIFSPDILRRIEVTDSDVLIPLNCVTSQGPATGQIQIQVMGLKVSRSKDDDGPLALRLYSTHTITNPPNECDNGIEVLNRVTYIFNKPTNLSDINTNPDAPLVPRSTQSPAASSTQTDTIVINEENPLECDICNRICKSAVGLKLHKRIHTPGAKEVNNYTRSLLFAKRRSNSWEKRREQLHTTAMTKFFDNTWLDDKQQYHCKHCQTVTFKKEEIYKHLLHQHKPLVDGKLSPCCFCDKVFMDSETLVSHVTNTHHKWRPFKCQKCGKGFTTLSGFERHMKNKKDKKNRKSCSGFWCRKCNAIISERSMWMHKKEIHATGKVFKCHICDKQYTIPISLKLHIKGVHIDRKCYTCGREFESKFGRKMHQEAGDCKG